MQTLTIELKLPGQRAFAGAPGYISDALVTDGEAADVRVAVLFARADSIYKTLPGTDVYDAQRNALTWAGGMPVVAHPPCRAWGRMRHFASPREGERELALWAVEQVRENGGVLEHPECSALWAAAKLPRTGRDERGGFTLSVDQHWWGHRANKPTWLYICGCEPGDVPTMPLRIDEGTHAIRWDRRSANSRNRYKLRLPESEREHTPPDFARWLLTLARLTGPALKPQAHQEYNSDSATGGQDNR